MVYNYSKKIRRRKLVADFILTIEDQGILLFIETTGNRSGVLGDTSTGNGVNEHSMDENVILNHEGAMFLCIFAVNWVIFPGSSKPTKSGALSIR